MELEEIFVEEDDLSSSEKDEAIIKQYKTPNIWRLNWFGDGILIFDIPNNISIWKRFWMWIKFGTKFTKL